MKLEDCQRRDINLTELARQIDYQPGYVIAIVNGRYRPSKKFLRALAKIPVEDVTKRYGPKRYT